MDDISQRTKTGRNFVSRLTKSIELDVEEAVTDPANDSSRSGSKFWKHSAPRSEGRGACLNIFSRDERFSQFKQDVWWLSLLPFWSFDL